MPDSAAPLRTSAILMPARSIASGVSVTSTVSSPFAEAGRSALPGAAIPDIPGIEPRRPAQPVRLADDVEVPARHVAHPALVDVERAPGAFILRERGAHLLTDDQFGKLQPALGASGVGLGRGDVPLVAVAHRQHDAHARPEIMEDVLDRPRLATVGQAVQHEPEVLALVADVDAGVPPPLRLLLLNLGRTHPDVG